MSGFFYEIKSGHTILPIYRIIFADCVQAESFSTALFKRNTSARRWPPRSSARSYRPSIIATLIISCIATWSPRTSYSWAKIVTQTSKSSISACLRLWKAVDSNEWTHVRARRTISLQRCWLATTTSPATCGQQAACSTFSSVDIHPSTETITTRSYRWCRVESSTLMARNGMKLTLLPKILSRSWLFAQRGALLPARPSNIALCAVIKITTERNRLARSANLTLATLKSSRKLRNWNR